MHRIYQFIGLCICRLFLVWWNIRDFVIPPKEDTVLFVAHPDDEVLFFHSFIKEKKPYIVVLFTGWSIKRFKDFLKVMKYYGVRHRIYPLLSAGALSDPHRASAAKKTVKRCLKRGYFHTIATHNKTGEYGHDTHKLVNRVVSECADERNAVLIQPVDVAEIDRYPLDKEMLEEKRFLFNNLYKSEKWVIDDYAAKTPVWFFHEKLKVMERDNEPVKKNTDDGTRNTEIHR